MASKHPVPGDSGMERKLRSPKHVFHSASGSGMCPQVNAGRAICPGGFLVGRSELLNLSRSG